MENERKESVQMGTSGGRNEVQQAMKINDLQYQMPVQTNVMNKRSLVKHFFTKNEYSPGEPAVCILSSGDQYISGKNSYLTFKVRACDASGASPSSVPATFGSGSAINVINRALFQTESGVEIERQEDCNLKARDWDYWTNPRDTMDDAGSVMGYTPTDESVLLSATNGFRNAAGDAESVVTLGGQNVRTVPQRIMREGQPRNLADWTTIGDGKVQQYCIPLSHILGSFNQDQLLPGLGFCGGARLEFTLETADVALQWGASRDTNSYRVYDIAILLDSFQLSDAVLSTLNRQSASTSLEVSFWAYDRTPSDVTSRVANLDSKRAVSRASMAWAKTRRTANTLLDTADCFSSEKYEVTSQSWQLAGVFLPNNPISGAGATIFDSSEQYYNALYVFGKHAGVNYRDFRGVIEDLSTDSGKGKGLQCVLLDRNLDGGQSGYPLSGSRVLQLRTQYKDAQNRTVHVFVKYLKVAKVFLDRAVVKE